MASSSIISKTLNEGKIDGGFQETAGGSLPRAYVTLLAGNGDDIMGVVCLAKGLRKVKTAYPLVVAVLPGVPEGHLKRLESQGCILRKIQPVYSTQLGCDVTNFSKLRLWDLDGYEKLVFLDSNVQVYDNFNELFDYPVGEHLDCSVLYAVLDCFCEKTLADNPQYNINLCQEELYVNDAMFVFEPSKKTFNYVAETLELIPPTPTRILDYFNMLFKGVYKPISLIYNLNLAMLWNHPEHVVDVNRVKVVHYSAKGFQPWSYTGEEMNMQREDIKQLVKKWWDVYNDESLDYKPPAQEDNLEPVSL